MTYLERIPKPKELHTAALKHLDFIKDKLGKRASVRERSHVEALKTIVEELASRDEINRRIRDRA